jgi:translation initiation factor 1
MNDVERRRFGGRRRRRRNRQVHDDHVAKSRAGRGAALDAAVHRHQAPLDPRLHPRARREAHVGQVSPQDEIQPQPRVAAIRLHDAARRVGHRHDRTPGALQSRTRLAHDRAMTSRGNSRIVFSTGTGRVCPGCGWPADNCRCSRKAAADPARAVIPTRVVAKLRMEKKGRGGKTVTVVFGLPDDADFLKTLCQDLKRSCGTGGAVVQGGVELQGDLRERVRDLLSTKGWTVKG